MKYLLVSPVVACLCLFLLTGCNKKTDLAQGDIGPLPDLQTVETSDADLEPVADLSVAADDSALATSPSDRRIHIVRTGDTLWSIASRTYGNGQRWRDLVDANPGIEPRKLRVGQELVVP